MCVCVVFFFFPVIPAKPQNLTVLNKTLDSAMLYWTIPFPLETFPPGVYHRIMYENQWDGQNTWKVRSMSGLTFRDFHSHLINNNAPSRLEFYSQVINITTKSHKHKKYYNLTGLEYANTVYDVRVLLKSAVASEDKWGDFSHVTFRTPPRRKRDFRSSYNFPTFRCIIHCRNYN